MKPKLDSTVEAKVQELSRRLDNHRKKYGSRCHPPEEIWQQAIALCEQAPLTRVAEGIGVSVGGLRNWKKAKRRPVKKAIEPRQPQFMEVMSLEKTMSLPPPAAPSRVLLAGAENSRQVELQRGDGSSLKITDIGAHGLDLRALIQGFMTSVPISMRGGHV